MENGLGGDRPQLTLLLSWLLEAPAFTVKTDFALSFQVLLRGADLMFPLLPKIYSVDRAVDRIVAEIGMDSLYQRMQLLSS
jgi:hypothetical protein